MPRELFKIPAFAWQSIRARYKAREASSLLQGYVGAASVGAGLPAMRAPGLCRSHREASSLLQGYVGTASVGAGLPAMRASGLCRSHREASSLLQGYVGAASVGAGLPAMRARICIGAIAGKLAPAGLCGDSFCGSWLASDAGSRFVSEPSRGKLAPAGLRGGSFCGSWLASDAGPGFVSEPSRGKLAPAGSCGGSFCGSWLASDAGPDLCRSHTGIWVAGSFYVWNAECYLYRLVLWVIRIYPCCHDLQEVQHEKHSGCLYGSTCALGR